MALLSRAVKTAVCHGVSVFTVLSEATTTHQLQEICFALLSPHAWVLIRIIASRLGVKLNSLEVEVSADIDVRGTMVVDRDVPVGFQKMRCNVNIQAAEGTNHQLLGKLLAAAENSCVNLQTLRSGVPVETTVNRS